MIFSLSFLRLSFLCSFRIFTVFPFFCAYLHACSSLDDLETEYKGRVKIIKMSTTPIDQENQSSSFNIMRRTIEIIPLANFSSDKTMSHAPKQPFGKEGQLDKEFDFFNKFVQCKEAKEATYLVLNNCGFKRIPDKIFELTNLEGLSALENPITTLSVKKLKKLKKLNTFCFEWRNKKYPFEPMIIIHNVREKNKDLKRIYYQNSLTGFNATEIHSD